MLLTCVRKKCAKASDAVVSYLCLHLSYRLESVPVMKKPRLLFSVFLLFVIPKFVQADPPAKPRTEGPLMSDCFVAWADGQEVEFVFYLDKLKAHGLTTGDLEVVKDMRFLGKNWTRIIKGVKIDLKSISEHKFRPLQAPKFAVKLLDGREVIINPVPEKISKYMVTGEYFRRDVTQCLDSPLMDNPVKAQVMRGIVVFGNVPHSTGRNRAHRSVGEPLENFAIVTVQGKIGPQAKELSRMRVAHDATLKAMGRTLGMSRNLFEKRFGQGQLKDSKVPNGPREYSLLSGKLEVEWHKDRQTVDAIYVVHGKELPKAKANEPEKLTREARELADADRAILLEFICKMRTNLTDQERTWICDLLKHSDKQLQWTKGERHLMLGEDK